MSTDMLRCLTNCRLLLLLLLLLLYINIIHLFCYERGPLSSPPKKKWGGSMSTRSFSLLRAFEHHMRLPSFDTLLTNAAVTFARSWSSCTNRVVMHLRQLSLFSV